MGKSLAVRLPLSVVEALNLQRGDHIEIAVVGERELKVSCDSNRERVFRRLRESRWQLPTGFRFDRDKANGR